jgi:hypothetical protein
MTVTSVVPRGAANYADDASQIRTDAAPRGHGRLRNLAIRILRLHRP